MRPPESTAPGDLIWIVDVSYIRRRESIRLTVRLGGGTAPQIFSCQAASTYPEAGLRFGELWQFRPVSTA
jgi:hypothetical protein